MIEEDTGCLICLACILFFNNGRASSLRYHLHVKYVGMSTNTKADISNNIPGTVTRANINYNNPGTNIGANIMLATTALV